MKNPIVSGWYADPESRVYNDKVYIYVTKSLPFEEQLNLDLVVTEDLENFTVINDILDMGTYKGVTSAVWAPSVIENHGKYYIIFAANNIHEDNEPGGLYIGVSDTPEGKFKNIFPDGRPIINCFHNGAQPIDAHFFKDDDGTVYLYYGGWRRLNVCKMSDDLTTLLPVPGYNGVAHAITPQKYVEAPFVWKFDGVYSMMYSSGSWTQHTYCVKAAVAKNPLDEFKFMGDVLYADDLADGPGHNSAFIFKDTLYTAYHRRIIGDTNKHHRVLCIDKLTVKDGVYQPVKMT